MEKIALSHRLEAYLATLHGSSLTDVLKRSAGSWQVYAAVTGSAFAMATGASAAVIQGEAEDSATTPSASVRAVTQRIRNSANIALINDVKASLARQQFEAGLLNRARPVRNTTATATPAPSITTAGVVPLYSKQNVIQPGEWVSIYGTNLATATAMWNNDFPITLGGTSVTINGKQAYLLFVSPGQIDLQAPDETATGTVPVVVTTANGSSMSTVTLNQFAPSFSVLDGKHISGIIIRSNGRGAFGKGTYDILGPDGDALGYPTMPAKAGDTVVLYGFGFGPTNPLVPAGQVFSGSAPNR